MADTFPSRPLHFINDLSGVTLCGKERTRVRYTSVRRTWDNPLIAPNKRCAGCAAALEAQPRRTGEGA